MAGRKGSEDGTFLHFSSSVSTNCSVSPGANGMTVTPRAGIRVTIQIENAFTTMRTRKLMPAVFHEGADR